MSAAVVIDILAAVKEALRDPVVRDQIRAIVVECGPAPANDTEHLLDAAAAAEVLGMTKSALRMAVYRGTIPCVRVGRRLRFRLSELVTR
jgi:excisionase family DNA binding protein